MRIYKIKKSLLKLCGEEHLVYGITYYENGKETVIENITADKEKIEFIAEVFNREQPEYLQISDILENFLLDFTDF